jgi:hypothetical protein
MPALGSDHAISLMLRHFLVKTRGILRLGRLFRAENAAVDAAWFSQRESCAKRLHLAPVCAVAQLSFELFDKRAAAHCQAGAPFRLP